MKRLFYLSVLVGVAWLGLSSGPWLKTGPGQFRTMVTTYCVTCHSARLKTGGLALEGLDIQSPADNADIWEKALRKLRGHQMPPPGIPQPAQKDVDSFVAWMESTLDAHAKARRRAMCPSSGSIAPSTRPR